MEQNLEPQFSRGLGPQPQQSQKAYPFPTEVISLPSKGLCYPEGHPLAKGEITIKEYSAIKFEFLDGIAKITIHRPKVYNAFRPDPKVQQVESIEVSLTSCEVLGFAEISSAHQRI